jgi:hypothetical protein
MRSLFAVIAVAGVMILGQAADVKPAPSETQKGGPTASVAQVTLTSDGETWVSITNVQQPAKFQSRKVNLPPGNYQVIGRRRGYRDVEKSFRVRGGEAFTLTIICTVSAIRYYPASPTDLIGRNSDREKVIQDFNTRNQREDASNKAPERTP